MQRPRGYLSPVAGKPPFDLEEFQQDGEAEPAPVGTVCQHLPLAGTQGPVLGEFLLVPESFHDPLLIPSDVRRRRVPQSGGNEGGGLLASVGASCAPSGVDCRTRRFSSDG